MEDRESTSLFQKVADLHTKLKLPKLKEMGKWEYRIGDWTFVVNGHDYNISHAPAGAMRMAIHPFTIIFWYKGWYIGYANARNTIIVEEHVAGHMFTVKELEDVLENEIRRL